MRGSAWALLLVGTVAGCVCGCNDGGGDGGADIAPTCGDGVCSGGEDCETCAADCRCVCGDGACSEEYCETCARCPADCGPCREFPCSCGDGVCNDYYCLESCANCPSDCGRCATCGNGICDVASGERREGCPADCGGEEWDPDWWMGTCGDGICDPRDRAETGVGEDATTCPADCEESLPAPGCGDGICDPYEGTYSPVSCAADCRSACGDGICGWRTESGAFDTVEPSTCPADCPTGPGICGDGTCNVDTEECNVCPADCGECAHCGDGYCQNDWRPTDSRIPEDCVTCPADCGTPCVGVDPSPVCGNGACEGLSGENCMGCADCGVCPEIPAGICGDGHCWNDGDYPCHSCPADCGECSRCGDGVCMRVLDAENSRSCPADCGEGPLPNTYQQDDVHCDPGDDRAYPGCMDVDVTCNRACSSNCDCAEPWTICATEIGGALPNCVPIACGACFAAGTDCRFNAYFCSEVVCT